MSNNMVSLGTLSEVGAGDWKRLGSGPINLQASLVTALSAVVVIEFSGDAASGAIPAVRISLDSSDPSDGIALDEELSWPFARMRVESISGGSVTANVTAKGSD